MFEGLIDTLNHMIDEHGETFNVERYEKVRVPGGYSQGYTPLKELDGIKEEMTGQERAFAGMEQGNNTITIYVAGNHSDIKINDRIKDSAGKIYDIKNIVDVMNQGVISEMEIEFKAYEQGDA